MSASRAGELTAWQSATRSAWQSSTRSASQSTVASRAGYLSASILSALPIWREFDPLPILAKKKDKKKDKSDEDSKDPQDESDIGVEERLFD